MKMTADHGVTSNGGTEPGEGKIFRRLPMTIHPERKKSAIGAEELYRHKALAAIA